MLMFKEAINKRPSRDNALSNESFADVHNRCCCRLGTASTCEVIFEISYMDAICCVGSYRGK